MVRHLLLAAVSSMSAHFSLLWPLMQPPLHATPLFSQMGLLCITAHIPPGSLQEDDYGRARVHTQWGDDAEYIEEAVSMCPVDCISYVSLHAMI